MHVFTVLYSACTVRSLVQARMRGAIYNIGVAFQRCKSKPLIGALPGCLRTLPLQDGLPEEENLILYRDVTSMADAPECDLDTVRNL